MAAEYNTHINITNWAEGEEREENTINFRQCGDNARTARTVTVTMRKNASLPVEEISNIMRGLGLPQQGYGIRIHTEWENCPFLRPMTDLNLWNASAMQQMKFFVHGPGAVVPVGKSPEALGIEPIPEGKEWV